MVDNRHFTLANTFSRLFERHGLIMAIGYACIAIGVPDTGLSRCILKNATEHKLRSIITANLSSLEAMIDYNIKNDIRIFRISSDIIPFGSHPVNQIPWWVDYQDVFQKIGAKIKTSGMRVSMHPGQYTVLNAKDPQVVQNALADLQYHANVLDALTMDYTCKLVLHIGGVYGDKVSAMKTFIRNYHKLPEAIKNRLIIENDDKNYTIEEVLSISEETGAPVVFDNLHHDINPVEQGNLSEYEWIVKAARTWKEKDGRQKIHYSQRKEGAPIGAHSDTVTLKPFIEFYDQLQSKEIDIMLEVKDKNLSAIKCLKSVDKNTTAKHLEEEWVRYKYFVLSRSANLYKEIRELLKNKEEYVAIDFYERIEKALYLPENKGAEVNAAQHVWGYISKDALTAEKNRFEKLMDTYETGTGNNRTVKNHLFKCAQIRNIEYLLNSLYFYI